jgi:hypothetical protein
MAAAVIRLLVQATAEDGDEVVVVDAEVLLVELEDEDSSLEQALSAKAASSPLATSPPMAALDCILLPIGRVGLQR